MYTNVIFRKYLESGMRLAVRVFDAAMHLYLPEVTTVKLVILKYTAAPLKMKKMIMKINSLIPISTFSVILGE